MAEPLKNSFGPDVPARIADMLVAVEPAFDRDAFLRAALDGFEELELTPRARQIADALAEIELTPGATRTVRKTVSLAQHSTRTPYPGTHRIEVLLNGAVHPGPTFEVT